MNLLPLAHTAFDSGDFRQAAELYRAHLHVHSADCNALASLAAALYHLDQPQQAMEALQQALLFNDGHTAALLNMSILLNDQGRAYESGTFLFRLLLTHPTHPQAHTELAYAILLSGNAQAALNLLRQGQPQFGFFGGRLHFIRAQCLESLSDLEQAERGYVAALACQKDTRYAAGLERVRTRIWKRRLPLLSLREQPGSAVARLDANLFALLIKHC